MKRGEPMARFGKYTAAIYGLLALVILELIALAGVLLTRPAASAPTGASAPTEVSAETPPIDEEMPAWLEPAEAAVEEKEPPPGERTAAEILDGARIIAHGMGAIGGRTTLNCLEGFQEQYKRGVRVFEVDLRLTADQQVVLRHDWRAGWQAGISELNVPTLEEFLDKPIRGRFTPLSFRDLLELMERYPDICIVTDTKFTDAEIVTLQFQAMLRDGEELGLSYLFDRMVIQVYDELMFRVVDHLHHFNYYIYTLYTAGFARTEEDFQSKADFCAQNGIMGITMWDYWWREPYAAIASGSGLKVYTHTVNDADEARSLLDSGVSGVYTDELTPADLASGAAEEDGEPDGAGEQEEQGGDL